MKAQHAMNRNDTLATDKAARFQTTQWTLVLRAAQSQLPGSRAALANLYRIYWYPLFTFIRRRGYNAEDAQDLTQGFFFSMLERKSLRQVTRRKGKFRSFLLASLKNYLSDEFDRKMSIKRGGQVEFVALDFVAGERRYRDDPVDFLTAEKVFDARWAMTLLNWTIEQLRKEYAAHGKTDIIDVLRPFLDPNCKSLPSYEKASNALNVSPGRVKSLVHRLRRRCNELLRQEVARTVTDKQAINEEIHALCEALIASEGRLSR
jgi:RNA polymerase sigma factor (sigma-70 family)